MWTLAQKPKPAPASPQPLLRQARARLSGVTPTLLERAVQLPCPCGGGCPKCQAQQAGPASERLHTEAIRAGDPGVLSAAPSPSGILQRQPDKRANAEKKWQQRLDALARDPAEAHRAWPRLSVGERIAVSERMRRRYGQAFAQQFLDEATKGKPQLDVTTHQPGSGPTADQLTARGWRMAGSERTGNAGFEVEIWVHPSGRTLRRDVSTWKFGAAEPATKPAAKVKPQSVEPPTMQAPPAEVPELPTQTTERHQTALDLLDDLHLRNEALHDLCAADPFRKEEAEDAQINWTFSRERLRDFRDVDWRGVHPDFWQEVADAAQENAALLEQCCKRDPSNYWFDCKR